jgi:putative ABC transport system substrate-binding protein
MRRVGVLTNSRESDEQVQFFLGAFGQSLGKLGWIDGRNIRIDYRWGAGLPELSDRVRHRAEYGASVAGNPVALVTEFGRTLIAQ